MPDDHDDHDETDSPPACCKSCGVPFVEHAGLQGCCAKLQNLIHAATIAHAEFSFLVGFLPYTRGGFGSYEELRDMMMAAIEEARP